MKGKQASCNIKAWFDSYDDTTEIVHAIESNL